VSLHLVESTSLVSVIQPCISFFFNTLHEAVESTKKGGGWVSAVRSSARAPTYSRLGLETSVWYRHSTSVSRLLNALAQSGARGKSSRNVVSRTSALDGRPSARFFRSVRGYHTTRTRSPLPLTEILLEETVKLPSRLFVQINTTIRSEGSMMGLVGRATYA
jgi:hypothetical protein